MSIRVDRIIAYTVNLRGKLTEEDLQVAVYEEHTKDNLEKALKDAGYQVYGSDFDVNNGRVTIIHDGMDGEYTKLCYVVYNEFDCDDYSNTDFYSEINSLLFENDLPYGVETELDNIAKLFGIEISRGNIKLEVFRYFH